VQLIGWPVQLHAPASLLCLCLCNSMRPHLFLLFSIFPFLFAGAAAALDQHARSHLLFLPPFFLQARLRRWKSMRADLGMSQVKLLVFLCRT